MYRYIALPRQVVRRSSRTASARARCSNQFRCLSIKPSRCSIPHVQTDNRIVHHLIVFRWLSEEGERKGGATVPYFYYNQSYIILNPNRQHSRIEPAAPRRLDETNWSLAACLHTIQFSFKWEKSVLLKRWWSVMHISMNWRANLFFSCVSVK